QIVGSYSNGNFLYNLNDGTYTNIDVPLGMNAHAEGINDLGQIVGWYEDRPGHTLGFVATPQPNPAPPVGTTADMILRGPNALGAGQYKIYDIGNNAILASYQLAPIATDWQVAGLGKFSGTDTTDMMLRSTSAGTFQVRDIANNDVTSVATLGTVGLNWQIA